MARPPLTGVSERLFRQQLQEALDYIEGLIAGAGIADGDYGDITVSGSGTVVNINAGAVGATELAANAVETAKIADNAVQTAKIQDGAVTFAKLAGAAVITSGETVASNDNDTSLPTTAAVIDYANSVGRVLLATKTASASSSVDFTEFNNSAYRRYEFELENVLLGTDAQGLRLQMSTNGGSSYDSGASDYSYTRLVKAGAAPTNVDSSGATFIGLTSNQGNAAGEQGASGIVSVWGAGSAVKTTVQVSLHYSDQSAGHIALTVGSGMRLADQDTDAIRFTTGAANIASGTIRMFGII